MKKTVEFQYERSVRWGAEQATLHDALYSMGLIAGDSHLSSLYRKVYGSENAAALSQLRHVMTTPAYTSKVLLLTDSAVTIPKGLFEIRDVGKAEQGVQGRNFRDISEDLQPLQGRRVLTPTDMADLCNGLLEAGQIKPFFRLPAGEPFTEEMFTPDSKGEYREYLNANGELAPVEGILYQALGSLPSVITEADLDALTKASEAAQAIGISLDDAATLAKPPDGISEAVSFSLRADWTADDKTPGQDAGADAGADWLRFNAERPGGKNYDGSPQQDLAAEQFDRGLKPVLAGIDFTGTLVESARRATIEAAKDNKPLSQNLQYDVRRRDADVQKRDTYAVLRIASGFNQQWGDIYANPGKFKTLFQTNKFLLQGHQEPRAERMNFVETFGPTYLYLFGERPNIWSYTGVLMDTVGLDWLNEWRSAWKTITGGTRTAKAKARAFLIYRDVVREGIIISSAESASINEFGYAQFSFTMFVIHEHFLSGDPKPGQTSPSIQSTPQNGQQASVLENYDTTFLDVTYRNRQSRSATSTTDRRVATIEEDLTIGRTTDIENGIRGQAFSGGQLVAYAGSLRLPLATAEAQQSIAAQVRLAVEADMTPGAEVTGK